MVRGVVAIGREGVRAMREKEKEKERVRERGRGGADFNPKPRDTGTSLRQVGGRVGGSLSAAELSG